MLHSSYPRRGEPAERAVPAPQDLPDDLPPPRRRCGDWPLLVAGSLVILAGLIGAVQPGIREQFSLLWPDATSEVWFRAALWLSAVSLAAYFLVQRKGVKALERANEKLECDAEERSRRHWRRLHSVLHVSQLIGQHTDVQTVFDGITEMCVENFNADWASMMRFEKDTAELVVCAASGPQGKPSIVGRRNSLGEGLAGWVARHRRAVLLGSDTDARDYPGITLRDSTITGSMVVPIILRNELVGVINVSTRQRGVSYGDDDLRTLEVFAENAGACIRHVEHVTWLRTMVEKSRASDDVETERAECATE